MAYPGVGSPPCSARPTELILEVGDAIYSEDDVVHTARGASDEPTVVLGPPVLTTGEPLLKPASTNMSTATT